LLQERSQRLRGMVLTPKAASSMLILGALLDSVFWGSLAFSSKPTSRLARPTWGLGLSLYQILFHFKALLWESIILLLPAPLAKPTLLQYYCTPISQYTPPTDRPRLCMPYTIKYWRWQYRVKAKTWGSELAARLRVSPSLAFTRYWYYQYCMVYGIKKRGRRGGLYTAQ